MAVPPFFVCIGGGAVVRSLPRELAWCGDAFTPPPSPPRPDWELAAWMREHCAGALVNRFYNRAAWRALRARVLAETHGASLYELAQSPSRYVPARYVHHVMRVHEHPEWALSEWATLPDGRVIRNLMPLSFEGHEVAQGPYQGQGARREAQEEGQEEKEARRRPRRRYGLGLPVLADSMTWTEVCWNHTA